MSKTVANVAPQKIFEPMEQSVGQDKERVMKSTGSAREALEEMNVQIVDRPVDAEKLAMLAFMEEEITVHIQPTTNPQDEQVFEIGCNGEIEVFRRGEQKTVKRKFANIMATQKITTYTQLRRQNQHGIWEEVQVPHTGIKYPFSVMRDPNPMGPAWFQHALAQH